MFHYRAGVYAAVPGSPAPAQGTPQVTGFLQLSLIARTSAGKIRYRNREVTHSLTVHKGTSVDVNKGGGADQNKRGHLSEDSEACWVIKGRLDKEAFCPYIS